MINSTDLFRLDGKSAVITGATGALGHAAARALAQAGARLTLTAESEDALAEMASDLTAEGHDVRTVARRPDALEDAKTIAQVAG